MFPLYTSVLPALYKRVLVTDISIICRSTNVLSLQTSVLYAGVKCHNYRHLYYLQVYKCFHYRYILRLHYLQVQNVVITDICIICSCTSVLITGTCIIYRLKYHNYRYLYYLHVYKYVFITDIYIICRCTYVLPLQTYVLSAGVQMCSHYRHLYYLQEYKCVVTTNICIICRCTNVFSLQKSVLSAGIQMCSRYRHLYYLQENKCVLTTDICIICRCQICSHYRICIICRGTSVFSLETSVLSVGVKYVLTTDICIICRSTNVFSLQTSVLSAGVQMCSHYRHLYYLQEYKYVVTTDICIICRRPQRHRTVKAVQVEAVYTKHYRIIRTRVSPKSHP